MDAVRTKLEEAILYIERNPKNRKINHVLPLYRQVTLIWSWYQPHMLNCESSSINRFQIAIARDFLTQ